MMMLAVGAVVAPWPKADGAPTRREIRVNARMFAFEPARLHVNRGDQVTLILHSDDVVHGLYLDGYDVNIKTTPGRSVQATFVANRAGKFRYRCSVTCGSLHPFMIGELIVGPNVPFWRAIALTVIAAAGAVAFFYVRSLEAAR